MDSPIEVIGGVISTAFKGLVKPCDHLGNRYLVNLLTIGRTIAGCSSQIPRMMQQSTSSIFWWLLNDVLIAKFISYAQTVEASTNLWTYFARGLVHHAKSVSVKTKPAMEKLKGCIVPS